MKLHGFFDKVYFSSENLDSGWLSKFEAAADVCRAPSRWVANELWNGGIVYKIYIQLGDFVDIYKENQPQSEGIKKVIRVVVGLILAIPGQLLALPLMGIAFFSEEIRLKHKLAVVDLSDEEFDKLERLIEERKILDFIEIPKLRL